MTYVFIKSMKYSIQIDSIDDMRYCMMLPVTIVDRGKYIYIIYHPTLDFFELDRLVRSNLS